MRLNFWRRKAVELGIAAGWLAGIRSKGAANVILDDDVPTKACVATGCYGTMSLHGPTDDTPPPTHLEFPRYATWVCVLDPAHTELVSLKQWSEILRDHQRRKG